MYWFHFSQHQSVSEVIMSNFNIHIWPIQKYHFGPSFWGTLALTFLTSAMARVAFFLFRFSVGQSNPPADARCWGLACTEFTVQWEKQSLTKQNVVTVTACWDVLSCGKEESGWFCLWCPKDSLLSPHPPPPTSPEGWVFHEWWILWGVGAEETCMKALPYENIGTSLEKTQESPCCWSNTGQVMGSRGRWK